MADCYLLNPKGIPMRVAVLLLVMFAAVATTAADKPSRRYIKNTGATTQSLPFSEGVLVGDTLYVSGHLGIDPQTGQVPANVDQEIKLLLDAFQKVVRDAGMTMNELVQVTIFCPDL